MLKCISRLLDKSGNEHEDQRRLHLTFLVVALIIMLVSSPLTLRAVGTSIYFGFIGLLLISLALVYMNQLWLAKVITPLAAFMLVTRLVYGGGIHDDAVGGYYFILLVAGLMLGQRAMLLFGVMNTLAIIAIGVAETSGLIDTRFGPLTEPITIATTAFFMLATTLALNYLVVRLNRAAIEALQTSVLDVTERQREEEARRSAEDYLHTVLNNAPITIYAIDREGIFRLSEGKGLERAGLKLGENVGVSALDLYRSLSFVEQTGEVTTGGDIIRRVLTGETIQAVDELQGVYFDNHIGPIRDVNGNIVGIVGVATDITDQQKTQEELRQQKELLQTIVDNIPVMMVFISSEGRTEWINREWQRVLGWSLEEAQGREPLMEMYPDPMERQAVLDFALESSSVWKEFKTRTRDGKALDTVWANIRLSSGEIIGIGYDNSRRKAAEEKIAFQAKLLDAVSNAVIATDVQGRVIYWNPTAEKLYGWSASEALGRNIVDLTLKEQSREQAIEIMEELTRGRSWSGEFLVRRKDGGAFPAFVSDSPVLDNDGNLTGIIGVSSDITERRKAEEEIRRQVLRAETLVRTAARLNRGLDLDAVIRAVCEETIEAFDVSQCAMSLHDENHDWFAYAGGVNIPPEEVAVMEPISRQQFEEIVRAMGPLIIIPNIQVVPGMPNAELNKRMDVRTVVVSTMTREGQLIGTLTLGVIGRERLFTQDEQTLLKALSYQAAQAILNAKLLKTERAYRRQLRALSARLSEAEENERRKLAGELHDRVGQTLTALNINLNIMRDQISEDSAQRVGSRIDDSIHLVDEAVMHMRNVMADLHPPVLDDYGLTAALRWYADRFSKRTEIPVHVEEVGETGARLSSRLEVALFRIAQEALTNVARHAQAGRVFVQFGVLEEAICMTIEDDGRGFDPAALTEPGERSGWGLQIMRERIEAVGGSFHLGATPGRGTQVTVEIAPQSRTVAG
ncbi:MAG TPA: PAS domain S-box protein [Anaerolineales bacterium]|nr:PAS domain S-box protein [Anaerolineales bacterium]